MIYHPDRFIIETSAVQWDTNYTYSGSGEIQFHLTATVDGKPIKRDSKITLRGKDITGDIFGHHTQTTTSHLSGLITGIDAISEFGGELENVKITASGRFNVIATPKSGRDPNTEYTSELVPSVEMNG